MSTTSPPAQARGPNFAALAPEVLQAHSFEREDSAGLFIGVRQFIDAEEQPSRELLEIPYAVDDAIDLAALFALELELVSPARVRLLLSGEPQKESSAEALTRLKVAGAKVDKPNFTRVLSVLREVTRSAGEHGLLLISVATHGFSQGGERLLCQDSIRGDLEDTSLAWTKLADLATSSPCPRRLILLDACRERVEAGRAVGSEAAAVTSSALGNAIQAARGLAVLCGAPPEGYCYDDPEARNGAFTARVLEALRHRAQPNDQGLVTLRSMAEWVDVALQNWLRLKGYSTGSGQGISLRLEPAGIGDLPLAFRPAARKPAPALEVPASQTADTLTAPHAERQHLRCCFVRSTQGWQVRLEAGEATAHHPWKGTPSPLHPRYGFILEDALLAPSPLRPSARSLLTLELASEPPDAPDSPLWSLEWPCLSWRESGFSLLDVGCMMHEAHSVPPRATLSQQVIVLGQAQAGGSVAAGGSSSAGIPQTLGQALKKELVTEVLELRLPAEGLPLPPAVQALPQHCILVVEGPCSAARAEALQLAALEASVPLIVWGQGRPTLEADIVHCLLNAQSGPAELVSSPTGVSPAGLEHHRQEWLQRFLLELRHDPQMTPARAFALATRGLEHKERRGLRLVGNYAHCVQESANLAVPLALNARWYRELDRTAQEGALRRHVARLLRESTPRILVILLAGPQGASLPAFLERELAEWEHLDTYQCRPLWPYQPTESVRSMFGALGAKNETGFLDRLVTLAGPGPFLLRVTHTPLRVKELFSTSPWTEDHLRHYLKCLGGLCTGLAQALPQTRLLVTLALELPEAGLPIQTQGEPEARALLKRLTEESGAGLEVVPLEPLSRTVPAGELASWFLYQRIELPPDPVLQHLAGLPYEDLVEALKPYLLKVRRS